MKYLVLEGGKEQTLLQENEFHRLCLERGHPIVTVRHLPHASELHWDYVTLSSDGESGLDGKATQDAHRGFLAIANALADPLNIDGDVTVGWIETASRDKAERLADILVTCFDLVLSD